MALASSLVAVWAFYWEPAGLRVVRYPISLPSGPPEISDLRIALIGDLHVGAPYHGLPTLSRVVALTNQTEPDLVLLAGDFVIHGVLGGSFVPPESIAPVLARLEARLGVFAVLGNHDWWLDGPRVRKAFEGAGIPVLDDRVLPLSSGSGRNFWLVGFGDFWSAKPDADAVVAQIGGDAPALAFTHNPDLFPEIPDRIALTMAGHTHGGQVRLPFIGAPVVPSRYGQRFARGHVIEGGRHLFVTTGVGTSILPVRLGVPPEIALITLSVVPATPSED